ncbi:polysaccharide biosynthesis tyrosine autokinase [Gordonia polyisoprenivorans]|uniref:polysaccharide biosynthesis tyrosine autokinase n=1 Tax=Gordonia polyisoprenivorans TaxID=84595 RepID=UPI001AD62B31|nr:polysaccharide biosynthesis tyrosine autokinase [Gordonia polyisoprenivorans]QTI70489.1 protein tyrosine kinase [Gordonia polyisoprenivorans]
MAVREYVHILVKFWWVLIAGMVILATAGFVYGMFIQPVKYVSTAKLFVSAEGGTSVGESYQNNLFAEARVNSYAQVATSDQVAERASRALNGQVSAADLKASTTATPVDKTVILDISVSAGSAARAQSEAAAVTRETVAVVQELETSRRGGEPAATAIVYDEASLPGAPSGPAWWLLTALGAVVGLIVGVVVALLLGLRARRRVNDPLALADTTDLPVLAVIADEPARAEAVLITDLAHDPQGDGYRDLRNNVRFIGAKRTPDGTAPRLVAVVGAGSEVGTSTVAANLAAEIGGSRQSVVLVDGDLRDPSLTARLGGGASAGLSTILTGESDLLGQVQTTTTPAFLPAGPVPPAPGELLGSRRLEMVLAQARQHFDVVVVDAGALGPDARAIAGLADGVVVVARRGRTTRSALRTAVESVGTVGTVIGTVLTFGAPARRASSADAGTPARTDAARSSADSEEPTPAGTASGSVVSGSGETGSGLPEPALRESR